MTKPKTDIGKTLEGLILAGENMVKAAEDFTEAAKCVKEIIKKLKPSEGGKPED